MLKSLFVMAFALFGTIAAASAMDKDHSGHDHGDMKPLKQMEKPVVARFTADWCGSCKVLEPKLQEAISQLEDKTAFDMVTFDFTDDTTKAKAAAKAGETGLTDLYQALAPKTGMAILVKDGAEAVRITKTDSVEVIKAKLETFIALNS